MDIVWIFIGNVEWILIIHNNCIFPQYGYSTKIVWIYYGFSGATANFVVWILHFFPVVVGGGPKFMFLFCLVVVVCTSFMHITLSFDLLQIPEQCIVNVHERMHVFLRVRSSQKSDRSILKDLAQLGGSRGMPPWKNFEI